MNTPLHDKPITSLLPLLVFVRQVQVIVHKQRGNELRHLHPADVSPQAHSGSGAKGKEEAVHVPRVVFQPAVWTEGFGVFSVDGFVAVDDPGIGADDGLMVLVKKRDERDGKRKRHTFLGRNFPAITVPPSGTTRGRLMPTAGWHRKASYMTAWR